MTSWILTWMDGWMSLDGCGWKDVDGWMSMDGCRRMDLVGLILFFTSHQQSFSYKGTGLHGLNQY